MPVTCACFAAGALALSGVFPTAGFFSKDEVLAAVLAGGHPIGFAILVATAGMTAFYIGRAFFVGDDGTARRRRAPARAARRDARSARSSSRSLAVARGTGRTARSPASSRRRFARPRRAEHAADVRSASRHGRRAHRARDRVRRLPAAPLRSAVRPRPLRPLVTVLERTLVRRRRLRGGLPLRLPEDLLAPSAGSTATSSTASSTPSRGRRWIGAARLTRDPERARAGRAVRHGVRTRPARLARVGAVTAR